MTDELPATRSAPTLPFQQECRAWRVHGIQVDENEDVSHSTPAAGVFTYSVTVHKKGGSERTFRSTHTAEAHYGYHQGVRACKERVQQAVRAFVQTFTSTT